jgi:alpha-mannosidase
MLRLNNDGEHQVSIRALKKAEDSEEIVLRVQELYGRPARDVQVALADAVASAREINAAEEETAAANPAKLRDGNLVFSLNAYQPRSFALTLKRAGTRGSSCLEAPSLHCPSTSTGISTDANRRDGISTPKGALSPPNSCPRRSCSTASALRRATRRTMRKTSSSHGDNASSCREAATTVCT